MLHLPTVQANDPPDSRCISRMPLAVVLMVAGSFASAAQPSAKEKTDTKEPPELFRAYLPTIRLKALLDCERQSVADLETWFRKYDLWMDQGFVSLAQRDQIMQELLEGRIRVLRCENEYRDALDQFTQQFSLAEERRRQMENATCSPLMKFFRGFDTLARDWEVTVHSETSRLNINLEAAKMRPAVVRLVTESALVKNSTLPKRFRVRWREWEKIDDLNTMREQIQKNEEAINKLRDRQWKDTLTPPSEGDRQRLDDLVFETELGNLQYYLRSYERQPWGGIKDHMRSLNQKREILHSIGEVLVHKLFGRAYMERLTRLYDSWPDLDPVRLKDVDLIACDREQAERSVASLSKTSEAQWTAKRKVRRIRTLAEIFSIQRQLFQLALVRRGQLKEAPRSSAALLPDHVPEGRGWEGSVGSRRPRTALSFAPEAMLKAEASLTQTKRQILQTWIDYQMVRLDLFSDLGLPPPERHALPPTPGTLPAEAIPAR